MYMVRFLDLKKNDEKNIARFEIFQQLNHTTIKSVLCIDLDLAGISLEQPYEKIVQLAREIAIKTYHQMKEDF